MAEPIVVGSDAQIEFECRSNGALVDPTVIKVYTYSPAGVAANYTYGTDGTWTKVDTGHYRCLVEADEAGTWLYRIVTDPAGGYRKVFQGRFDVEALDF